MEKKMVNIIAGSKENFDKAWHYYDSLPKELKQLVLSIKTYDWLVDDKAVVYMEIDLSGTKTEINIPAIGHIFKSSGVRNDFNFVTFVVGGLEVEYKIEVTKNENHLFFALNNGDSSEVVI